MPCLRINTILVQITWVFSLDKTEGATDRSGEKTFGCEGVQPSERTFIHFSF